MKQVQNTFVVELRSLKFGNMYSVQKIMFSCLLRETPN